MRAHEKIPVGSLMMMKMFLKWYIYMPSLTLWHNKAMPPQNAAFTANCSGLKSSFCMAMIGNAVAHAKETPCICCFVATFLESKDVMP